MNLTIAITFFILFLLEFYTVLILLKTLAKSDLYVKVPVFLMIFSCFQQNILSS